MRLQVRPQVLPLLLAPTLLACAAGSRAATSDPEAARAQTAAHALRQPPPTEHVLSEEAEELQKERRKAWFEERHKAPPEVDWKAVERENGLAQIARRNLTKRLAAGLTHWVERGSENQAGRMHVATPSSDGALLYAGSSKGGVWKNDGGTWTPIGDNLYGGAHRLVVLPPETPGGPDVVVAATGGGLVHVSRDDGATWEPPTNPTNIDDVRRLLVTSDGTHTVFLLCRNGTGQNRKFRLFRSKDGARSFERVYVLDGYPGDVWTPRTGSGQLWLATGGQLLTSTDLGDTWTTIGPITGSTVETELVGSEAGAPTFYAAVRIGSGEKLYVSEDGGATWGFKRNLDDYWGSLNASTLDPDVFAYGGVEVRVTRTAGNTFSRVNSWGEYYGDPANKLHADVPGIDVIPYGATETWYVATDGGLYSSDDALDTVFNLSLTGLRVSQYYSTLTSSGNPDKVSAGSQDQGYQWALGPPSAGTRIAFDQVISGDYGHLTSGNGGHRWVFSTYPGFILVANGATDPPRLFFEDFPTGETNAWMPPVVADPEDIREFFFCASRLYRYEYVATNDWSPVLWSTFDFGASPGEYVSAFELSPMDVQRAYAVTNRGRLFHSQDKGVTWTQSQDLGPSGQYFYGTAFLASSVDVDTVVVGGSGYGVPAIYRSTDGGLTYQVFDQGLPDTLVYCLGEAPDGSGTLFCGTESSVYRRNPGASEWADVTGSDAPVTTYWSVEALPHENTMRFGTYGRGIWDYRLEPPGELELYGCGLNPAGSLVVLDGLPAIGGSMTIGLANPAGTQGPGSLGALQLSFAPAANYPCGTPYPAWGMEGTAEILVSLAPQNRIKGLVLGTPWGGPGTYSEVTLGFPSDPAYLGVLLYAQGLLYDPAPSASPRIGLTEAVELKIGHAP